jgi:hypothetical protein
MTVRRYDGSLVRGNRFWALGDGRQISDLKNSRFMYLYFTICFFLPFIYLLKLTLIKINFIHIAVRRSEYSLSAG